MGKYKDKNGKTRVGDFLRGLKNVAPEILDVAGSVTGIEALSKLGEKIKGDTSISAKDKEIALKLLEQDIAEASEVSERWKADMQSDSWLSKNVRPLVLAWLVIFVSSIIIIDSVDAWEFTVSDGYKKLLETLLVTVIVAYFGSRGFEKYRKIKNNN